MLILFVDELIVCLVEISLKMVNIGMVYCGCLNVLVYVLGKLYEMIFVEF